jgi:hypothetical protein
MFTNSTAVNSNLTDCIVINSTILDSNKVNCTIINSNIINSTNRNATIINTNETGSTDTDTIVDHGLITTTIKDGSTINRTNTTNSNVTDSILINSTIINSTIINSNLTNCTVINSTIESVVNSSCVYGNTTINLTAVPAPPPPPPPGQGGGGGGRGGGPGGSAAVQEQAPFAEETGRPCVEAWVCGKWGACENGAQSRSCSDGSGCGTQQRKPATSKACAVEQRAAVEHPFPMPQLKPAIDLFKARLWPLIIAIITLALLAGAYIHYQHRQPQSGSAVPKINAHPAGIPRAALPERLKKPAPAATRTAVQKSGLLARLFAPRPHAKQARHVQGAGDFRHAMDSIDEQMRKVDRGELPAAVRKELARRKSAHVPIPLPRHVIKQVPPPKPVASPKPVALPPPRQVIIPKPKPAQITPVAIPQVVVKPVRKGLDRSGQKFKKAMDEIDRKLALLEQGRLPASLKRKIASEKREPQRRPEPVIPAPKQRILPKVPAPKPAVPKPVQAKHPPSSKPVRVASIDDVRRLALEELARGKKFKDKERFRKKVDRIDENLSALEKKSRKRRR